MADFNLLLDQARLLFNEGKVGDAEQVYLRVLDNAPQTAEALHELGVIRFHQRRNDEALILIDAALANAPNDQNALVNRGNVLKAMGKRAEALDCYRIALEIDPDCAEALYNRGIALSETGDLEGALDSYDKALELEPMFRAIVMNNRGSVLWKLRRFAQSLAAFDLVLSIYPNYSDALNNRGVLLRDMRHFDKALADFDRALTIDGSNAEAWYNRGNTLTDLQRLPEARDSYLCALIQNPNHRDAPSQVASLTVRLCDWVQLPKMREILIAHVKQRKSAVTPFVLLAYEDDPLMQKVCAINYVHKRVPSLPQPLCIGAPYGHSKIRIAYLSADFHTHATASLIVDLIERHDRGRFQIFGISFGPDDGSPMRGRMVSAFDQFIDVRDFSDKSVAELLRGLEVDIALDLHGHTQGSRPEIFSYHPAPVQVSFLGYPGTSGADFIEYIIADPIVLPSHQRKYFTEKVAYLPDCYQPNDSRRPIAGNAVLRSDVGLPDGTFVFCCFNSNWKITPTVFDIWMRLLSKVPDSVLWLIADHALTCSNLRAEAQLRGVDSKRIVFAERTDRASHFARHSLADLFLDTLPVNAHTTASDALWAGLPLVTCPGRSFSGRVAASLLNAIGLPELVANDLEDYESIAFNLATDRNALEALRQKLARLRLSATLFDTDRFRENIEAVYTKMWTIAERGGTPESFG